MFFEKIKFTTEQEVVSQIRLFNFPIMEFYRKNNERKKYLSLFPTFKKNRRYSCEPNEHLFYLKINSTDNHSFSCLQHWIDIIEQIQGDFYIICDKENLERKVYQKIRFQNKNIKFIKSEYSNSIKNIVKNISTKYWIKATFAQLTTFYHAKKLGVKCFWNVDADDTMLCIDPQKCAQILKNVKQYADNNDIDTFSFDMHASRTKGKHWSFGVTYINNEKDWFKIFANNKDTSWRDKYLDFDNEFNLDWFFTYLNESSKAKCKTWYVDNIIFIHHGDVLINPIYAWIGKFNNNKIEFPILLNLYGNTKYGNIDILDSDIKFDIGLKQGDSEKYMNNFKSYLEISSKPHDNMWG